MSSGWLEVARDVAKLPGLLNEIYGDLLKPGVKQAGKALDTVIGLGNTVLWPLALVNEKSRLALERNLEKYRLQMQNVPEEKTAPIAPEVGVPIAEKLTYVSDEELSQMYINLLAKASTVDTANFAHPSFVNVINNLCPDEALVLKYIRPRASLPFVTVRLIESASGHWAAIGDLLTGVEDSIELAFPDNLPAYLSNFEGLGLIQIRRDITLAKVDLYQALETRYQSEIDALTFDRDTHSVSFQRGKTEVTRFGKLFLDACLTRIGES